MYADVLVPLMLGLTLALGVGPERGNMESRTVVPVGISASMLSDDALLARSVMHALDLIKVDGKCDYYCQDCANPEREWTHSWPSGGYEFSGDPACDPDTDCGALGCSQTEEEDTEDRTEIEVAFLQLVAMLEAAPPEVLATVIQSSEGLITFNETRRSVQVRRCLDRVVANLPVDYRTAVKLGALTQ